MSLGLNSIGLSSVGLSEDAAGGGGAGNAFAPGGTGTSTGSGSGGTATGGAAGTGSFTSDAMENNTGAGLLASVSVLWTLYYGQIGATPSQMVHGAGTTSGAGILTGSGHPAGTADLWVRTVGGTGVYYQRVTVA